MIFNQLGARFTWLRFFLDPRQPVCVHQTDLKIFSICVQIRDWSKASSLYQCRTVLGSICNWPFLLDYDLNVQGLLLQLVLPTSSCNIYKAIFAILALRNVMQCLEPQSVKIIKACRINSIGTYFAINASGTSCTLLKAEEGLMAFIFNKTFGSPYHNESSWILQYD